MHPKLHASIFQIFVLFSFILVPLLLCGLMSSSILQALAFLAAYGLIYFAIFNWLPVSCEAPGCPGRTERTMTRISFWKNKISYICKLCYATHEEEIFYPNIQVEVSG